MPAPPTYQYQFEDINLAILEIMRTGHRGTVLDLGCGRGRMGAELEKLGYRVTGIESNPEACTTARQRLTEVLELDLTRVNAVQKELTGRQFDWLVAADVLEHLVDPLGTLCFYRQYLHHDRRLVVSLPNVAVWDNRLRLLAGRFTYTDSGVMDRTHLRFFTFRTASQLVASCGFVPLATSFEPGIARAFLPLVKRRIQVRGMSSQPGPSSLLDSRAYRLYVQFVLPPERGLTRLAKGLFAFRVVMVARKTAVPATRGPSDDQSRG